MHVDGDETKTPERKKEKKKLSLNLKFETTPIEQVSKHHLLGVTVDEQLKWQTHINNMCRNVSRNIFLLSKLSQICQPKIKINLLLFAHIMSHTNHVSNAWDRCAGVHMKQLYSLHKRAVEFLMPIPNLDYKQKCCALKLLPCRQTTIAQQMCSNARGCSRQSPAVSERSHGSI